MLIPKFVYRIRREHYIYWEISRVARGLPKTFTYSTWDDKSVLILNYSKTSIVNDVSCGLERKYDI